MTKKHASAILALAVTLVFLALAARNVQLGPLREALGQAKLGWVPVMAALGLLDLLIRGARWKILLEHAAPDARLWLTVRLEAVGLALNNILFMRIGELARAFLASRELKIPVATALASVAVERALDVAALLSLFCLASAAEPALVPAQIRNAGALVLVGAIGALVTLALAERMLVPGGVLEKPLRPWPKLRALVLQLAEGASVLRSPVSAAKAAALSLALWAADGMVYWAAARAFSLGEAVTYVRSLLVLSWAGAGAALPAAPGAFGTFEAFVVGILERFGVGSNQAFAYAVFTHMVMYLLVTVVGLAFLYRIGLSLGELTDAVEKVREERG